MNHRGREGAATVDLAQLPLCPLAKRIAQPKRGAGSLREQTEAHLQYKAYVAVTNLLHHFPEERVNTETFIRDSILEKQRARLLGSGCFDQVSTFGKVDTSWVISWIAEKTQLDTTLLQKALIWDAKAITYVFCYMLNVLPNWKVPQQCIEKQFFYFLCDYVWDDRGKHMLKDANKDKNCTMISADGKVDWSKLAYDLVYDDTAHRVTKVLHRRTGTTADIDAEAPITMAFQLKDGWSDTLAVATNGKASHFLLRGFFAPKLGPNAFSELKVNTIEAECGITWATNKMASLADSMATGHLPQRTELVDAAADAKKHERTEKARIMLQNRKEEAVKRRRVSIMPA